MARIVIDSNVYIPVVAYARGPRFDLLSHCWQVHTVIVSSPILAEVERVLAGKFRLPLEAVRRAVGLCRELATLVEPAQVPSDACRDPDDCAVLGTATAAGLAEVILSGDGDLLALGTWQGVPILPPSHFWEWERSWSS